MNSKLLRWILAAYSGLLLPTLMLAVDAPIGPVRGIVNVRIPLIAINLALHRLSTSELIDRLQDESQYVVQESHGASHIERPALYVATFLPVLSPQRADPRSPVMAELVARGVSVLTLLLDHLSDPRPTKLSIVGPKPNQRVIGSFDFSDDYWPRYEEVYLFGVKVPWREIKAVNLGKRTPLAVNMVYTVTVGDLCYGVIGQIVNRRLALPLSRHSGGGFSVFSSPQLYPGIVDATRAEWSGLTPQEHEQSLRDDAFSLTQEGRPGPYALSAVLRLLYYYPEAGREVVESLLRRRLVNTYVAGTPQKWLEVPIVEQSQLMTILQGVEWPGWEETVYGVYQAALAQQTSGYRDELALQCAQKLRGNGHDLELMKFLRETIARNEAARGEMINGVRWWGLGNQTKRFHDALREFDSQAVGI